jgi:drug/metabolite transporter (DMT)-like permease
VQPNAIQPTLVQSADLQPSRVKVISILILGILSVSFAAIFIRLASKAAPLEGPGFALVIAAGRMGIAALLLLPTTLLALQRYSLERKQWLYILGAGFFLALHFLSWISSLEYTSVAASTALVTTNPLWVSLFSWLFLKESPSKLTWIGAGIALLGGALVGLGQDGGLSSNPILGNSLALLGAVAVSAYFLLGRQVQLSGVPITLYSGLVYAVAALFLVPLPWMTGVGYSAPLEAYLWIGLLALVPQVLGHTSFNWAVKYVHPTLVTVLILLEPIGASLAAIALFGEIPGPSVLIGALILLLGVGVALWQPIRSRKDSELEGN